MKKKNPFILFIILIMMCSLLSGCSFNLFSTTSSKTQNEEIETEKDVVTTIMVDLSPKLKNYIDENYQYNDIIVSEHYNKNFAPHRFVKLEFPQIKESYIYNINDFQNNVLVIKNINNDVFSTNINSDGYINISFAGGEIDVTFIEHNKEYYFIFINTNEHSTAFLNGQEVIIRNQYTGISLNEIATLSGISVEELYTSIMNDTILENDKINTMLSEFSTLINDWDDFIFNPRAYATKENTLLPKDFVQEFIQKIDDMELAAIKKEEETYRNMGAIKVTPTYSYYKTNEEVSAEKLNELKLQGNVSNFGLQVKFIDDTYTDYEYITGYKITSYTLEDGTPVTMIPNEKSFNMTFITATGKEYEFVGMSINSSMNYSTLWAIPKDISNSDTE